MRLTTPLPNQEEQPGIDGGDNTFFGRVGLFDMTSLVDSDEPLFWSVRRKLPSKREAAPRFVPLH